MQEMHASGTSIDDNGGQSKFPNIFLTSEILMHEILKKIVSQKLFSTAMAFDSFILNC